MTPNGRRYLDSWIAGALRASVAGDHDEEAYQAGAEASEEDGSVEGSHPATVGWRRVCWHVQERGTLPTAKPRSPYWSREAKKAYHDGWDRAAEALRPVIEKAEAMP